MKKDQLRERNKLGTFIIGSIPSYKLLDSITENKEELFLFVDFNNNLKGIYYPKMIEEIYSEYSFKKQFPSILINEWAKLQVYFESYLEYCNSKNKKLKKLHCIYFTEAGDSYYHKSLYNKYKEKRRNNSIQLQPSIASSLGSFENVKEFIRAFLLSSWKWIKVFSDMSNILSIRLENLDADFIPEFLLREYEIYNDNASYLILSSDGDMLQTLDYANNIYIYDNLNGCIIDDKNWLNSKRYLDSSDRTTKSNNIEIFNEYYTPDKIILYKALVGDTSDSIPGIKGIGKKGFFNKFISIIPDDVRADDVDSIFKICKLYEQDNNICKLILNNKEEFIKMIKLVSFKKVIEWLRYKEVRNRDIRNQIDKNINALRESCYFKKIQREAVEAKEGVVR